MTRAETPIRLASAPMRPPSPMLLHAFSAEFGESTPDDGVSAERASPLIGESAARAHIDLGTSEDDVAARALYEGAGFTNRDGGPDGSRMLYTSGTSSDGGLENDVRSTAPARA